MMRVTGLGAQCVPVRRVAVLVWCAALCWVMGAGFAEGTLAPELARKLNTMQAGETVRIVVALPDKADLRLLAGHPRRVLAALQATAARGQSGIGPWLEARRASRGVVSFRPFWIVNEIAVECDAGTARAIAARRDVGVVRLDKWIPLSRTRVESRKSKVTANNSSFVSEAREAEAGASVEWNIAQVRAPEAWAVGATGAGVVVGSIDTGVDYTHPDLAAKWRGYPNNPKGNWFDAIGGSTYPYDDTGHGTHTMGTILGGSAGGTSIGVAPGATWIAAKAFGPAGGWDSDVTAAMQWMMDPNGDGDPSDAPRVVSNSWGSDNAYDTTFLPQVQAWLAAGIFPCFASGNNGQSGASSAATPGNFASSFSVGATDADDVIGWFSGRGPAPSELPWNGVMKPDVSAPGVSVSSSVPGGGYAVLSGTSMAAPHVTGAVALLLSVDPTLTVAELEWALESTAVDLGRPGPDSSYGWGRIDCAAAVDLYRYPNRVSGRVQAWDGTPIAGAVVTFTTGDAGLAATTDAGGDFSRTLPDGSWTAAASAPGYDFGAPLPVVTPPGAADIAFTGTAATGRLAGRVTEKLVTSTQVESPHPYPGTYDNTWVITTGGCESRAHFTFFDIKKGYDTLSLYDQNDDLIAVYSGYRTDFWTPWVAGPVVKVRLVANSQAPGNGFVIDAYAADGGRPMPGVTVTLSPGGQSVVTDGAGAYRFTNLAPTTYVVSASAAGKMLVPERLTAAVAAGEAVSEADFLGDPYRFVVYDEDSLRGTAVRAMAHLGCDYVRATGHSLDEILAAGPCDLVVVDAPMGPPAEGWEGLISYLQGGGSAVLSTSDLTDAPDLCTAFGAQALDQVESLPPLHTWETAPPLFAKPQAVPDLTTWDDFYPWNADRLQVASADATAVAGFTDAPDPGEAALIAGNGGRTILNGFLWDEGSQDSNQNGIRDVVELVMNEVSFVTAPTADFAAGPVSGEAPLQVAFIDLSTRKPTAWTWTFGDGASSAEQNPIHIYAEAGAYTVTLTVANATGSDTTTRPGCISVVPTRPAAQFEMSRTSGPAPLVVQFTDTSIHSPTAWAWTFGDGGVAGEQSPVHAYTRAGSYTVSLTVTNAAGASTETKENAITATRAPRADFVAEPATGTAPLVVALRDTSGNTPTAWEWDFGDGSTSTEENPAHVYAKPGRYAVTLRVTNAAGEGALTKQDAVVVTFSDVPAGFWAADEVLACVGAGIVTGYTDSTYGPSLPVTRAQMAVYISRALLKGAGGLPTGPAVASFADVPTDYWAFRYVEYAKACGIVQGYPDGYHPEEGVNRGQLAVFVARATANPMGDSGVMAAEAATASTASFPDVPPSFWAYPYIQQVRAQHVVSGYEDGDYHPEVAVTRDQMAVYMARAFALE